MVRLLKECEEVQATIRIKKVFMSIWKVGAVCRIDTPYNKQHDEIIKVMLSRPLVLTVFCC